MRFREAITFKRLLYDLVVSRTVYDDGVGGVIASACVGARLDMRDDRHGLRT